MHHGSCLCGAVRFQVACELPAPDICHCQSCRKQSGHLFASTDVPKSALTVTDNGALSWYASSAKVRRGFCSRCGSTLFWEPVHRDWIAIAMGSFDTPTQTTANKHIFVREKGDYYEIADRLPQDQ